MTVNFRYPLNEQDDNALTTRIKFSALETTSAEYRGSVMLYMPQSVSFSDGASYSGTSLGAMGAVNKALESAKSNNPDSSTLGLIKDGTMGIISNMFNGASDIGALAGVGANSIPFIGDVAKVQSKVIINPNTHTLFNGVNVRSFSFSFVLIAESEEESVQIREIDKFFRANLYPSLRGGGFIQQFPYQWQITFLYNDQENTYLPKIHKCFLESYSSSFNTQGNSFHRNGAPFDVSMSLSFMETKAYSKESILTGIEDFDSTSDEFTGGSSTIDVTNTTAAEETPEQ